MRILTLAFVFSLLFIPANISYAGGIGFPSSVGSLLVNTDTIPTELFSGEAGVQQVSAYYDLRERSSYIQVTNVGTFPQHIHVQIFQHDRDCNELDFFDVLTVNDTVIYDLDNIIKNDGSEAPINLADDSYGYVVITNAGNSAITGAQELIITEAELIGNFRIIDDAGYEYRANMAGINLRSEDNGIRTGSQPRFLAHFNTVDGAKYADLVGYGYYFPITPNAPEFTNSVKNFDNEAFFSIFVFDMNEEPLSCDRRSFVCGKEMNYGINEDYPNSKGGPLLCPGGGLANPSGGFVQALSDPVGNPADAPSDFLNGISIGLIGLNNGNGTGSMDYIFYDRLDFDNNDFDHPDVED